MILGIPKESLPGETRVAMTPESVRKLVTQGHVLRIERGAGRGANAPDELSFKWTKP
ncbi:MULTISPECIES: hypothetical protein [unclassified Variovorax]|uniref:hypothetical protein n=1 Tax=Variovorax sp. Sphag1AA TaxID=2587027 RepID=UPI00162260DE|nr:alanine dehydrogenase [Variovorax sp. Sphag1AA]